jgi:UDP-2,4-diacetamido-2,4,6-trideoxy-beta-L-altropyranose hydrolase
MKAVTQGMKIVFRADASSTIGTGHVMRCLALAHCLERARGEVVFVCRELPGHLCDEITANGFTVLRLPADTVEVAQDDSNGPPHAAWLGTSWQQDASRTRAALEPLAPVDWLIVDHYALDARWELAVRSLANNLMAIDDLFDRPHDVDLLLNQSILHASEASYAGLLPSTARQLLGPCFALLQKDYKEFRNRTPPRSGKIGRVLVYFGGVDAANLTGRSLEALRAVGCGDLAIDVVLPVDGPHTESILDLAARLPVAHVHEALPSLARLMASADLAIGAGGTTSWERLCLGLPALVVTLSDNQLMIAQALQVNGLARWLGHHDEVTVECLADALRTLLQEGLAPDWSTRCRAAVDGAGVERVAALLALGARSRLTTRPATVDDEVLVGDWLIPLATANDPSYGQMLRTLGDDLLYLLECAPGVVVGAVLCAYRDGAWQLQTLVSPAAGTACPALRLEQAAMQQLRADKEGLLLLAPKSEPGVRGLRIALCSDQSSWINDFLPAWALQWRAAGHSLAWAHDAAMLPESDVCFYLSYGRIVGAELRARHGNNLVVHESDLPAGRGWSPLTWQVLQGAQNIVVTLFEAADEVDAGVIYGQSLIQLRGDELVADLRRQQAEATFKLCTEYIDGYPSVLHLAREQQGTPSYFQRRTPADSRIDLDLPLRDQFNLLRVCDSTRYPAWFEYAGARYMLNINRVKQDDDEN